MNPFRACRTESETVTMLNASNAAQLNELCLLLGLPNEQIPWRSPVAQCINEIWNIAKKRGDSMLADLEEIVRKQQFKPLPLYWLYASRSESERKDPFCQSFFDELASRTGHGGPDRILRLF
jgi:hypothetical protein